MNLRAKVRKATGESTNYVGTIVDGKPVPVRQLPNPEWLEISKDEDAFLLLYLDADGKYIADTWHQTIASAKREAMLSFGVLADDWEGV